MVLLSYLRRMTGEEEIKSKIKNASWYRRKQKILHWHSEQVANILTLIYGKAIQENSRGVFMFECFIINNFLDNNLLAC
jgi:hypothetical protein